MTATPPPEPAPSSASLEERYGLLVEQAADGVWVADPHGRFVEVNPAACAILGYSRDAHLRLTIADVVRREGEALSPPELLRRLAAGRQTAEFRRVDGTSVSIELSCAITPDGLWQGVGRAGSTAVPHHGVEWQAVLLRLSDALRPLDDAVAIQEATCRLLGEHLRVDRAAYCEADADGTFVTVAHDWRRPGTPSVAGSYRIDGFGTFFTTPLREGRVSVIEDVLHDPRVSPEDYPSTWGAIGVRAAIAYPLVKQGRLAAAFFVHDAGPRVWTAGEVALVVEVAERGWAAVERARAEALLRRSEEAALALVENAPFGVYLVDSEFRLRTINAGSRKVFSGIDPLIGRDFAEVIRTVWQEPFATEAIERFRHTLKTGEPFISPPIIEQRANVDGTESYDWQIHRITLPGDGYGVVCYFYDLTEQKRLEEAVRRSAERDAYLVKLSDVLRPLAGAVDIQAAAARTAMDSFQSDRCYYCEIEDDKAIIRRDASHDGLPSVAGVYPLNVLPIFKAVIGAGRPFVVRDARTSDLLDEELRQLCLQLEVISFIDVPVIKDGQPVGLLCITQRTPREWTGAEVELAVETAERTWAAVERGRAEEALRQSEARLQLALDVAGLTTWEWDLLPDAGGPEPGGGAIPGLATGSSADRPGAQRARLHPDDLVRFRAGVARGIERGGAFDLTFRVLHHDGAVRHIAARARAVTDESGRPIRLMGTSRDVTDEHEAVTDRERLLAAEQAARAEAEAANRAKDAFLSTLSHELRTPLTPILGFVEMLRRGRMDEERQHLALETIERSARVQARLVNDLLDMSRIVSGKLQLEIERTDLPALVQRALDAVRPASEARHVTLTAALDPETGPVLGDTDRLRQVVDNLLTNAIKFTPAGGRIDVQLTSTLHEACLTVADTGVGIPAGVLPYVFERFLQADSSATRAHGGLGLGLAIVKYLVERHEGAVTADSPGEGQGATFTVRLPLLASRPRGPGPEDAAVRTMDHGRARLAGVRVLVVDDDADTQAFLRLVLEDAGAAVATAASSAEGLAAFGVAPPDVLLVDIGMPGEDGYGFLARLRAATGQFGPETPAIAVTAFVSPDDRQRALAAGFSRHLAKPVDGKALLAAVTELAGIGQRASDTA